MICEGSIDLLNEIMLFDWCEWWRWCDKHDECDIVITLMKMNCWCMDVFIWRCN